MIKKDLKKELHKGYKKELKKWQIGVKKGKKGVFGGF